MTETVASLQAVIGADVSNALTGFEKVKSGFTHLTDSLKSTGAALTIGVTAPILGFLGTSLKAASDNQTGLAQLNAVIKSTGGAAGVSAAAAEKLADNMAMTTRYSKDQVLAMENVALTFTNINKRVFPDTIRLAADMSQAMGQDLQSSIVQIGKALQDPITGVTALKRVGVDFSDAQRDVIKAMVESGNVAGAQALVLKELQKEFGGSAVAAGQTFAGQMDIVRHKFDDFQEKVGNIIMPILSGFVGKLSGAVDWLQALPEPILQAGVAFGALALAAGPVLTILGNIGKVIGAILSPAGLLIIAITAIGALGVQLSGSGSFADMLQKAATAAQQLGFILLFGVHTAAVWVRDRINELVSYAKNLTRGLQEAVDKLLEFIGIQKTMPTTTTAGGVQVNSSGMNLPGGTKTGDMNFPGQIAPPTGTGFAAGGYTGESGGWVHGHEYVVPEGGALVSKGGPSVLHVVLQAQDFEQHLYVNIAQAMAQGT